MPAPAPAPAPLLLTEEDLDLGFAAIERKTDRPPSAGTLDVDLSDVRSLFGQLAVNHMRQLRDFIIELRWGPTPSTWIAVCESSVESLQRAAESLGFTALAGALGDLARAMQEPDLRTTPMIDGFARERILAVYVQLEAISPETFASKSDGREREAAILHSLLSQIPDVRKVTIDKLYAAGLTSLETMLLANVADLVSTTGIPEALAVRIVDRFREYRTELAAESVDETRAAERAKIEALVEQLARENEEFERAAGAWSNDAMQRKKDLLLARTQTMLAIELQLARLGEVALVRELERLPFARKLTRMQTFVVEARIAYGARPSRP